MEPIPADLNFLSEQYWDWLPLDRIRNFINMWRQAKRKTGVSLVRRYMEQLCLLWCPSLPQLGQALLLGYRAHMPFPLAIKNFILELKLQIPESS